MLMVIVQWKANTYVVSRTATNPLFFATGQIYSGDTETSKRIVFQAYCSYVEKRRPRTKMQSEFGIKHENEQHDIFTIRPRYPFAIVGLLISSFPPRTTNKKITYISSKGDIDYETIIRLRSCDHGRPCLLD